MLLYVKQKRVLEYLTEVSPRALRQTGPRQALVFGYYCLEIELFCSPAGWKITVVGSRCTHVAESRYASEKGVALAVADGLDKAKYFVLGCENLIVEILRISLIEIESESGKESKGDINISVAVIGNFCYGDWGSKVEFDYIGF